MNISKYREEGFGLSVGNTSLGLSLGGIGSGLTIFGEILRELIFVFRMFIRKVLQLTGC